jgi:YidC/Oxa1 family membrane protein insertase
MNIFAELFKNLIYRPELNLLKFFFNLTNDIGLSIIILATIINLVLWPLYISTYLNSQKVRYLQPKLKELQAKYKDNQQDLLKATMDFNKKHGVNNSAFLWVILGQIFFAAGLWTLTKEVSDGNNVLYGLYDFIFKTNSTTFNTKAFNFLDIGKNAGDFLWLPLLSSIFSFIYGMYTFRWSPKLPPVPKPNLPEEKKKDDKTAAFDPESFQKSIEFQTIYIMPGILFIFNYNLPIGVNIYFCTVNFLSLVRQIYISKFYSSHTLKFIEDLSASDPDENDNVGEILNEDIEFDPSDKKLILKGKSVKKAGQKSAKSANPKAGKK